MTTLEDSLERIISIFHRYSVIERQTETISKGKFKQMITQEMPNILGNRRDQDCIDKLFQELDADQDTLLSFNEYLKMLMNVLQNIYNIYSNYKKL